MESSSVNQIHSIWESFEVDEAVAVESQTMKHMIEDECIDNGIPLPNVKNATLAKVIEYCKKHVEDASEANAADKDIYGPTKDTELKTVADMMIGKTTDEIRTHFNIQNDYTEEILKEIDWAFE